MENILVEMDPAGSECDMVCKVADFGFACSIEPGKADLTLSLGSPQYMAPEVVEGQAYGQTVDIWSLGVIAYYLLTGGNFPFDARTPELVCANICSKTKRPFYDSVIKRCEGKGAEAKDFLEKCLEKNPAKRPTAGQLLEHKWLRKFNSQDSGDGGLADEISLMATSASARAPLTAQL